MRRATVADADIVNALLNDPLIRPTIGGEGELDASDLLADERNICIVSPEGGSMFAWRGPGIYEGHSFYRVRGRRALTLCAEAVAQIDARMIWGLTPEGNKAARWFSRQLGFKSLGMIDTPDGRCELFVMEK